MPPYQRGVPGGEIDVNGHAEKIRAVTEEQLQTTMFVARILWVVGTDGQSADLVFRGRGFRARGAAPWAERLRLRAERLEYFRSAQGELKRIIEVVSGKGHLLRLQALK